VSNAYADRVWTAVVKCPATVIGLTGEATPVEIQLERQRAARGKERASEYYWMPPMAPPWQSHFRFGQLQAEAK